MTSEALNVALTFVSVSHYEIYLTGLTIRIQSLRTETDLLASVGQAYISPYSTVKIMHCAIAGSSLEKLAI